MTAPAPLRERLWRVRKNHTWIDAQAHDVADGVEVGFAYDGARIYTRRFPSREIAMREAERTLRELQRAGWVTHW
jgi:hypothetical protein